MISMKMPEVSVVFRCPDCGALAQAEWDWDPSHNHEGGAYQKDFEVRQVCCHYLPEEKARHLAYSQWEKEQHSFNR